jgi:HK97 family phage major capsid protein
MKGQSLFIKASRYNSRRFPQIPFGSVAYNTDAGATDVRTESELLDKIQGLINQSLATRATKTELEAIIASQKKELEGLPIVALRAMADDTNGAMAILARQGLEIQRLQTSLQTHTPKDMSLRGQIKAWLESPASPGSTQKVAELVRGIVEDKQKRELPLLELRLDSPMLPSTVNPSGSPYIGRIQVEDGINPFIRQQPTFWDYLKKGRTNSPIYVWVNQATHEGEAAWIGPGEPKPGVSFTLEAEQSTAKKIADSAKAATELLQDIDGMATFIEDELKYKVMIKVNDTLMNATGTTKVPAGIKTYATTFPDDTGLFTDNPNYMDAVRAVVGYLRSGLLKGQITVFVNSIDLANMDMAKAIDSGVYLMPSFVTSNGMTIAGAAIVEDNSIPVGSIFAGFLQYYRILVYKDFTISWGWENDDFTRNLVTAVGEMRLHQFFNTIHTGAFVFDTFENVIAALGAAPGGAARGGAIRDNS